MLDPDQFRNSAAEETKPMREYIIKEALDQYRDYYETDSEEQKFFEYFDNLNNRDKIRFGEIFKDYSVDNTDTKDYMMI